MDDFIKRIGLILEVKNLNYSDFAEAIGIQRSMVSHIMSGRNNPSLDVVTKILNTFPDLRSDWLLFGKGAMIYDAATAPTPDISRAEVPVAARPAENVGKSGFIQRQLSMEFPESEPVSEREFQVTVPERNEQKVQKHAIAGHDSETMISSGEPPRDASREKVEKQFEQAGIKKKSVEKIVIFYTDHTFREYFPESQ